MSIWTVLLGSEHLIIDNNLTHHSIIESKSDIFFNVILIIINKTYCSANQVRQATDTLTSKLAPSGLARYECICHLSWARSRETCREFTMWDILQSMLPLPVHISNTQLQSVKTESLNRCKEVHIFHLHSNHSPYTFRQSNHDDCYYSTVTIVIGNYILWQDVYKMQLFMLLWGSISCTLDHIHTHSTTL